MGIENKDLIVQDQQSGSSETKDILLNQEQVSPQTETQKLFAEPQTPEQTPFQKEQEKLKLLFEKAKNQIPLLDSPQVRELLSKLETQDPFLTSAFLTDFLASDKANFPYASDEKLGPLGQKKRYGEREHFATAAEKLAVLRVPAEIQQQFGRCFDLWKKAFLEHARGSQNDARVLRKQELFIHSFLEKFPAQAPELLLEDCKRKRAEQGTLTFEVFLDDIAKSNFPQGENLTFSDLYSQWEQGKIQQLGRMNMSIQAFEKALQLSGSNNAELKAVAQKKIEQLRGKGLTKAQMETEVERIYNECLEPAIKGYGMLNREEVIKTTFVGLKPQDYQEWGLFFKKVQLIGKYYYGYDQILIDWKWWPQTEGTLRALKDNPAFSKESGIINMILKTNKSYGEKSESFANKLKESYKEAFFDRKSIENRHETEKVSDNSSDASITMTEKNFLDKNKNIEQALEELPLDEVEAVIPRETYLKAIWSFLQKQEAIPSELRTQANLAADILDWTWSGEEFEAIKELWEQKAKPDFLRVEKNKLQEKIKKILVERAKFSRDDFFKKVGLPLNYDPALTKAYEKQYGKAEWTYSVFIDSNNPGHHYIFNHSSGYLSARKTTAFDKDQKQIAMDADEYEIILRFPTAQEQFNQALDVSSYLPQNRPNTFEDLDQMLSDGVAKKVSHSVGEIEASLIQSNIEKNRVENAIFGAIKEIFYITPEKKSLSKEADAAYYEMIVPLLNTIKRSSNQDLLKLKDFIVHIKEYLWSNNGLQKKESDPDNLILQVLAHPHSKTHLQKEGKNKHKTDFWLGILFSELEKLPPWAENTLENKVLDLEKIDFLNTSKTKEELYNHSRFWSWYRKTAESISQYGEQQEIEFLEQKMSSAYQQTENLT